MLPKYNKNGLLTYALSSNNSLKQSILAKGTSAFLKGSLQAEQNSLLLEAVRNSLGNSLIRTVGEIFGSSCTVALLFLADLAGFIEITLFRAKLEAVEALSLLSRVRAKLEAVEALSQYVGTTLEF